MSRFRVSLVALFSLVFLVPLPSHAATWVIPDSVETLSPYVSRGRVRYALPTVSTSNVPRVVTINAGSLGRRSLGMLGTVGLAASIGFTVYDLYNTVKSDPSTYPNLAGATKTSGALTDRPDNPSGLSAGTVVLASDGNYYQITSGPIGGLTRYASDAAIILASAGVIGVLERVVYPSSPQSDYWRYYASLVGSAPVVDATPAQFENSLSDGTGEVKPEYIGDIDRYIREHPTTVNYSPSSTTIENEYNDYIVNNYNDTVNNYKNTIIKNYNDAVSRGDDADAAYWQSKLYELLAQQAKDTIDKNKEESLPDTSPDSLRSFDWSKWIQLKGLLQNTWPFSLLLTIPGYLSGLIVTPTPPTFNLPIYGGNTLTISLSIFDPIAVMLRWLIGVLVTVGGIQSIIKFWRGA